LLGINAELIGLFTGFPFGSYRYGRLWQPTISLPGGGYFPLLLPFAWLLVCACSYFVASWWISGWPSVLVGGLLGGVLDLVMEPVMTERLRYWTWTAAGPLPGRAPVTNLVAWCVLCCLGGLILRWAAPRFRSGGEALIVLLGQAVLMGVIWVAA